jgi:hypothetical protein
MLSLMLAQCYVLSVAICKVKLLVELVTSVISWQVLCSMQLYATRCLGNHHVLTTLSTIMVWMSQQKQIDQ